MFVYVLMPKMLEQLELPISALGEDRSTEGFHDLLDRHSLTGKLVLCRAIHGMSMEGPRSMSSSGGPPDKTKGSHADWLQVSVPVALSVLCICHDPCKCIPAGDLKGGPEDLGTHKLRHVDSGLELTLRWKDARKATTNVDTRLAENLVMKSGPDLELLAGLEWKLVVDLPKRLLTVRWPKWQFWGFQEVPPLLGKGMTTVGQVRYICLSTFLQLLRPLGLKTPDTPCYGIVVTSSRPFVMSLQHGRLVGEELCAVSIYAYTLHGSTASMVSIQWETRFASHERL